MRACFSGSSFFLFRLLVGLMVAGLLFSSPAALAQQAGAGVTPPASAAQIRLSFAPVVKKVAPAVVSISSKKTVTARVNPFMDDPFFAPFFQQGFGGLPRKRVESALGSGIIVSPDGLIVTNSHVVRGADEITVTLADGREFPGKVSVSDEASDLALVRIVVKGEALPFASLDSSESLEVGDLVIAIGNPFGVGQTVTSGIVSAQARPNLDINDFNFFIQTDAAINPGNSGGPLVDMNGGVVGINTAIYSRDGGSLGIGFAIPTEMVKTVIAAEGKGQAGADGVARAWLGAQLQDMTSELAQSIGLDRPRGALVSRVSEKSPAEEAGLRAGDAIVGLNGKDIANAAELHYRWATLSPGDKADFKIWRQNQALTLSVPVRLSPNNPARDTIQIKGRSPLSGASLARLSPALASGLGLPDDAEGVVITQVDPSSTAARLVAKGDILLAVNGRKIGAVSDVQKALAGSAGRGFSLVLNRGGAIQQIMIR